MFELAYMFGGFAMMVVGAAINSVHVTIMGACVFTLGPWSFLLTTLRNILMELKYKK